MCIVGVKVSLIGAAGRITERVIRGNSVASGCNRLNVS